MWVTIASELVLDHPLPRSCLSTWGLVVFGGHDFCTQAARAPLSPTARVPGGFCQIFCILDAVWPHAPSDWWYTWVCSLWSKPAAPQLCASTSVQKSLGKLTSQRTSLSTKITAVTGRSDEIPKYRFGLYEQCFHIYNIQTLSHRPTVTGMIFIYFLLSTTSRVFILLWLILLS